MFKEWIIFASIIKVA